MRTTVQRKVIMETLKHHKDHPGAETIYTEVRSQLPKISLGTVYRNLDLLVNNGVISRLDVGDDHSHFDPEPSAHPHFLCTRCGSVSDLEWHESFDIVSVVKSEMLNDYSVDSLDLLVRGQCPICCRNTD